MDGMLRELTEEALARRCRKAEIERDTIVGMLADLFGWEDRSYLHAIMHAENAIDNLRADLAVLRDRLQFDPGGSDKIDELEQSNQFLRHRAETAEHTIGLISEWTKLFGKELCPPRADTYGEGVRDSKEKVAALLGRGANGYIRVPADGDGSVDKMLGRMMAEARDFQSHALAEDVARDEAAIIEKMQTE